MGALGWLALRQLGGGPGSSHPSWPVPPGSAFYTVRLGDRQVGIASFSVDTGPQGLRVTTLLRLDSTPEIGRASCRERVYGLV